MTTPNTLPTVLPTHGHEDVDNKIELTELEHKIDLSDVKTLEVESKFAHLNKIQTLKVFRRAVLWALAAGVGALFDGFAVVIPGSIIANPGFVAHFGTLQNAQGKTILDPQIVGAWGGVQSGGQIFAMWTGPFLSDRFGRKIVMWLCTSIIFVAIFVEVFASDWRVYMLARLLSGMAVGYVQSGITVYISEVSLPQIRGTLLAMYSVMYNLGGLSASSALKIVVDMGPSKFRHAFYAQFVFLGLFLPLIPFIPESPWYYARRHEHEKAKQMLSRLHKGVDGYVVDEEYEVFKQNLAHSEALKSIQQSASLKEIFLGTNGRRTFVACLAAVFGSFSGLSLVVGYTSYFFSLAGLEDPFLASLIIKLILNVFCIISFWTVETIGRRGSFLTGGSIMMTAMLVLGLLGATGTTSNGTAIVAIFAIHAASYSLSAGPLGWTYLAEVPTPRLRAKSAGFVAGFGASFGLLFNYTTPIMLADPGANWGLKIGFFWAGLTSVGLISVFFFLPETKGRTYNELDELFERKISARRFKHTTTAADEARAATQIV